MNPVDSAGLAVLKTWYPTSFNNGSEAAVDVVFVVNVENEPLVLAHGVAMNAAMSPGGTPSLGFGTVKMRARSAVSATVISRLPRPLGGVSGPSTKLSVPPAV